MTSARKIDRMVTVTVLADQRFLRKRLRKESSFLGGAGLAGVSATSVLTLLPLPAKLPLRSKLPANPGPANPGPANPGPANPGPANPGPANPGPANPGPADLK